MMNHSSGEVTAVLRSLREGDPLAASQLSPLLYRELRQMAARYMGRERADHTLQPTALVHEAYLKLVELPDQNWQNRAHFFGVAAQVMRHILVDHARHHQAAKRGGGQHALDLDEVQIAMEGPAAEMVALDEALTRLAKLDPRQGRVVELRFFAGLTVEETAEVMGISPKTVKRDWSVARAWLHREIRREA